GAIQTTRQLLRHSEGKIGLPATVVEIVIMKMDSTVMRRVVHPVVLAAVPGVPLHGSRWKIDGAAVPTVWRDIHHMRGWNAAAEITVPDEGVIQDRRRGLLQEGSTLRRREHTAGDHWLFELAVVKPASGHTTRMRPGTDLDIPGRHAEGCASGRMHSELRLAFCCGVTACVVDERSLSHPRFARGSVKTGGNQIPVAREQRHLRADELSAPAIAHEQSEGTRIVEEQRIAPPTGLLPGAEQGLASL